MYRAAGADCCCELKASCSESELLLWRAAVSTSCCVAGAGVDEDWSDLCRDPDPLMFCVSDVMWRSVIRTHCGEANWLLHRTDAHVAGCLF